MKMGKKATAACAFAVGALVFATSAMADVAIGSGYNSLKNSAKTTMVKLTKEIDNFTANVSVNVKVDDRDIASEQAESKFDIAGQSVETTSTSMERDGTMASGYNFQNADMYVYKSGEDEKYMVNQRNATGREQDYTILDNPFEEEYAKDVEAVIDAFVGSLKDVDQMEESEGKKLYIMNLSEAQIPTLANAITAFGFKYSVMEAHYLKELGLPAITKDIFVREVSGKAVENSDGILESVIATASLTGKDDKGNDHTIQAELSLDVSNIGSTTVSAPELTDENAEYSVNGNMGLDEKYVGSYKNDIVEVKSHSFVKLGERRLDILSVDENGNLTGKYYEIYNDGSAPENVRNIEFTGSPSKNGGDITISYTENGEQKNGVMYRTGRIASGLRMELDVEFNKDGNGYRTFSYETGFDPEFIRVFE